LAMAEVAHVTSTATINRDRYFLTHLLLKQLDDELFRSSQIWRIL